MPLVAAHAAMTVSILQRGRRLAPRKSSGAVAVPTSSARCKDSPHRRAITIRRLTIARAAFAGLMAAQATQACSMVANERLVTLQYKLAGEVRTVTVRAECPRSRQARVFDFKFAVGRGNVTYVTLGAIVCFLSPSRDFQKPASLNLQIAAPLADGGYATIDPTPDAFGNAVTGVRVAEASGRGGADIPAERITSIPVYREPWIGVTYSSRRVPAFEGKFDRPVLLRNKKFNSCKGLPQTHEVENYGELASPRSENPQVSILIKDGVGYPPARVAQSVSYRMERERPYLGDTGPVKDPPELSRLVGDLPIETMRCGVKSIGQLAVYRPDQKRLILIIIGMKY